MARANESDEAFARRLQAQEMGMLDPNTPLMVGALCLMHAVWHSTVLCYCVAAGST